MKQKLSGGVVAAIIVVVVVIIGFFGFRYISGGPNADITDSRIKYYREKAAKTAAGGEIPLSAPVPRGSQGPGAGPGAH